MYDVAIIGGGTGGYTAAIRAAKNGLKVLLLEKEKLGGACLHKGCIPTKAMLEFSGFYSKINEQANDWGIQVESPSLDMSKMIQKKSAIVEQLHQGVQYLIKKNKIDLVYGNGEIHSIENNLCEIKVLVDSTTQFYKASKILLATGARPFIPEGLKNKSALIKTSDDIVNLSELPESVTILGGGVIGIEIATFFSELGCKVSLIEREQYVLPNEDLDIRKEISRILKKKGIELYLNHEADLSDFTEEHDQIIISVSKRSSGAVKEIRSDFMLVAIGRAGNVEGLGLEQLGLSAEKGAIAVNEYMQTSINHLYAIGDITGSYQLAHVAAHQGMIAIDHILNKDVESYKPHMVPRCVYSHPEIASIGITEQQANEQGIGVKIGKFNFKGIGRALIASQTDGFMKIVTDAKTDQVLGVHIIGDKSSEIIGEAALGMLLETTSWEISEAIHPHPSINEIFGEAALAVVNQEING